MGAIALWHQFQCSTMEPREMLNMLSDELRNFCIVVEAPRTPFGKRALAARSAPRSKTDRRVSRSQRRRRTPASSGGATTTS